MMNLPNGPGWSPDCEQFWVEGNFLYPASGGKWDMRENWDIRVLPNSTHENNYAKIYQKKEQTENGYI